MRINYGCAAVFVFCTPATSDFPSLMTKIIAWHGNQSNRKKLYVVFRTLQGGNTLHIGPEVIQSRSQAKTCLSHLPRQTICSGSPRYESYQEEAMFEDLSPCVPRCESLYSLELSVAISLASRWILSPASFLSRSQELIPKSRPGYR